MSNEPTVSNGYVFARRGPGRKWIGIAFWNPSSGDTCVATAEDAFRMAGLATEADTQVAWGPSIMRQKNYSAGGAMHEVTSTAVEVGEWADLQRAKHYISNGWNLDSQPEAKAAALKHGLLPVPA